MKAVEVDDELDQAAVRQRREPMIPRLVAEVALDGAQWIP